MWLGLLVGLFTAALKATFAFLLKTLTMSIEEGATQAHEAAANAPSAGEYIVHHLTHFNSTGHKQASIIDFSVINVDTCSHSITRPADHLPVVAGCAQATSGVPGRFKPPSNCWSKWSADKPGHHPRRGVQ